MMGLYLASSHFGDKGLIKIDMGFNRFHIMKMYEISGGVPSHFVE